MGKGLSDDELKALVDAELRQSVAYFGGKLAEQRRKAEYYYLGLAKGDLSPPEIEGRSTVISTDVRNVVEALVPVLVAKFTSGDTVVEFEPTKPGPEEEQKAQSATDYINYLFFKQNRGFTVIETAIRDLLLQKKGIVKVYWDTRNEEKREEYKGLNDVELSQILDDEEVSPIEHSQYPDEDDAEQRQQALAQLTQQIQQAAQAAQQGDQRAQMDVSRLQAQIEQINQTPPKMLHDIAVKRVKTDGKLVVENVPPEEFLISRKAKTIQDAPFCAHRVTRTVSELKSMGYKGVDDLSGDDSTAALNAERIERLAWDDELAYMNVDNNTLDPSQRVIWVTEAYIRADRDGDGIAELIKVTRAGNDLIDEEVVDCAPFVDFDCVKLPHKFYGLSIADMAMEIQRSKTMLKRTAFDNAYLTANQRMFAVEGQVNLDDLLTSRPGGIVRIKNAGAVGPLGVGAGDGGVISQLLEYEQDNLERATGWYAYSQGTDADSLNDTATGVLHITSRGDMRTDLIARNIAEGFTDLFRMMLKLILQNQNKEAVVRLNGNFVSIDPREWRNQFDVSINVGLGTGDKSQQAANLMQIMQIQKDGMAIGVTDAGGVYQAALEFSKAIGFKSGDKFFTDPAKKPPQPPQPDPLVQVEQMKQQGKQAELQANMQLEQYKTQLEQQQQQHLNEVEAQRKTIEQQYATQLELAKAEHQMQLEKMKIQAQQELEWRKAQLENDTKVLVAQINARTQLKTKSMDITAAPVEDDVIDEYVGEFSNDPKPTIADLVNAVNQNMAALIQMQQQSHGEIVATLTKPKQVIRGSDGRVQGVV